MISIKLRVLTFTPGEFLADSILKLVLHRITKVAQIWCQFHLECSEMEIVL